MIEWKSWIKDLIESYPIKNKNEVIEGVYTFYNTIKLFNPNYDKTVAVSALSEGTKHSIEFLDKNKVSLGSINLVANNLKDVCLEFSVGGKKLGISCTDEGVAQSYVDTPTGNECHQIVNIAYLSDTITSWYNTIMYETEAKSKAYTDAEIAKLSTDLKSLLNSKIDALNSLISALQADLSKITLTSSGSIGDTFFIPNDKDKANVLEDITYIDGGNYIATAKKDIYVTSISWHNCTHIIAYVDKAPNGCPFLSLLEAADKNNKDCAKAIVYNAGRSKYGQGRTSISCIIKKGYKFCIHGSNMSTVTAMLPATLSK